VAVITDFLLNVAAILFAITAYLSAPLLLDILLFSPALLILIVPTAKDA
jgi:phosphatidylinositol glycan class W